MLACSFLCLRSVLCIEWLSCKLSESIDWPLQVLLRILNARQFGLKMIANVSYGYTSASFSGRMPMAELADSIVQVSTDE